MTPIAPRLDDLADEMAVATGADAIAPIARMPLPSHADAHARQTGEAVP